MRFFPVTSFISGGISGGDRHGADGSATTEGALGGNAKAGLIGLSRRPLSLTDPEPPF